MYIIVQSASIINIVAWSQFTADVDARQQFDEPQQRSRHPQLPFASAAAAAAAAAFILGIPTTARRPGPPLLPESSFFIAIDANNCQPADWPVDGRTGLRGAAARKLRHQHHRASRTPEFVGRERQQQQRRQHDRRG